MSQNCLKFWDKFETKLRTDLRPYRENFETYLTILLLRANWDIFETWVHSDCARALVNFSRVFLCHPYLHAYGSFLAENFQEFIWVFLKNENLHLHEIWTVYFLQFLKQYLKKPQLI